MALHGKPKTDQQWAREVERRLTALEHPRSIRMGNWMVSVSPVTGNLVADHIPTGRRDTLAQAQPDTPAPDKE